MQLGIFAKVFARPSLAAMLDAVTAHRLKSVQFGLDCVGLPLLPDAVDAEVCAAIRRAMVERGLGMGALSGTFNMIHPDPGQRRDNLRRLRVLAAAAPQLGTDCITLCTGTRDPDNMWRDHPDNHGPAAWQDLLASTDEALQAADEFGVCLSIEPEVSNVVDSARKARQLLDDMGSPRLQIVMDGANIFHRGELSRMREVLQEAFELLGRDIAIAHAKDLTHDGEAGQEAAGTGVLDYDLYLQLLRQAGFTGPLILHSLQEEQVAGSVAFVQAKMAALGAGRV